MRDAQPVVSHLIRKVAAIALLRMIADQTSAWYVGEMPLLVLDHIRIAFGHLPLMDDVALQVEPGERVCLIGRNGTGKSTLMQIVAGELTPDSGTVWRQPGVRVARLVQDVPLTDTRAVFDVVADGLGDLSNIVSAYHHAAHAVAEHGTEADLDRLGRCQHALEERDGWRLEQRVELVLTKLGLPADARVDSLSGGWRRRVLLARALVAQPDLLLLDEPTNHLDIDAIAWLEAFLLEYPGSVLFITHDRAFLTRLATRIVEIDRGRLTSWPGNYDAYLARRDELRDAEVNATGKFDKKLAEEEVWLRRGVKARRTRDEGRVKALMAMREERAARRSEIGTVRMRVESADRTGQMVFEAVGVTKSYGGPVVVRDLSTRILRGDRIGLIGPNGAGKTTVLRLLLGEIAPDSGEVRTGANVQVAYYDQQREQLDPDATLFDTIGAGNDTVTVGGRPRHVHSHLSDFLFPAERAHSPVKSLSGGERNRLLLARLFTRPANVLILDEPTNDLDLETLELLEEQLVQFAGTVLLVSHDRVFLDNVVTSTLAFEGHGVVSEYVGGYEDWLRQRGAAPSDTSFRESWSAPAANAAVRPLTPLAPKSSKPASSKPAPSGPASSKPASSGPASSEPASSKPAPSNPAKARAVMSPKKKLSYKEQREYGELPAHIERLEAEQRDLEARVAGPAFYKEGSETIARTLARLEALPKELGAVYARWDELDARAK